MTQREHGHRPGHSYRRLRRWARHTPNATIALNMVCAGLALILIAVLLAIFAL